MTDFPEPLVARSLGVNKGKIADARKAGLEKGRDWQLVDAVVCYTREGLFRLCRRLGLDPLKVDVAKNSMGTSAETPATPPEASAGPGEASAQPVESPVITATQVAEACAVLEQKVAPVDVEVTGVPANQITVHGRLNGRPVTVRVKNNRHFIPGLWIKASPLNGGIYYAQVGNPPRWKGDRLGFNKPAVTEK